MAEEASEKIPHRRRGDKESDLAFGRWKSKENLDVAERASWKSMEDRRQKKGRGNPGTSVKKERAYFLPSQCSRHLGQPVNFKNRERFGERGSD